MFQFTHPGRGATETHKLFYRIDSTFQFTHPGRGATGLSLFYELQDDSFNSRTPGGVRLDSIKDESLKAGFNSRTPGGVRLLSRPKDEYVTAVSIHAPREGCDRCRAA